jgi:hypothetical protein
MWLDQDKKGDSKAKEEVCSLCIVSVVDGIRSLLK